MNFLFWWAFIGYFIAGVASKNKHITTKSLFNNLTDAQAGLIDMFIYGPACWIIFIPIVIYTYIEHKWFKK